MKLIMNAMPEALEKKEYVLDQGSDTWLRVVCY